MKFYLTIIFWLAFSSSFAQLSESQVRKMDSLHRILNTSKSDSLKIKVLTKIALQYETVKLDSSLFYYDKALAIADEKNLPVEKAIVLTNIGFSYYYGAGNTEKLFEYLFESLKIYQDIKNKPGELDTYYNLGFFYGSREQFALSIEYLKKAEILAYELHNTERLAGTYNNIGLMYQYSGQYQKSIEYQFKAVKLKQETGDSTIDLTYTNIGLNYCKQEMYEQGLAYYKKALNLLEKSNKKSQIALINKNIGDAFSGMNELDSALFYYSKSLRLYTELNGLNSMADIHLAIGIVNKNQGEYKKARNEYKQALNLFTPDGSKRILGSIYQNICILNLLEAEKFPNKKAELLKQTIDYGNRVLNISKEIGSLERRTEALETLYKAHHMAGDAETSVTYAEKYIVAKDSLLSQEKQKTIADMQTKYETEQKEQEIINLQKDKEQQSIKLKIRSLFVIGVSVFALFILIFLIFVISNRRKLKRQNHEISHQKEELSAQAHELKLNMDAVEKLTKFKDDLTQMLVHDLKNPIGNILNIPKEMPADEKQKTITESALKMNNLVLNILDVQKYEDSALKIEKSEQNILQLWKNALNQFDYQISEKNISTKYSENINISASVDKELMERVFVNLISNAVNYTPTGGKIWLDVKIESNVCKISLNDNGIGISKQDLSTVFRKYGQSGKKISYSTGLGLTFCKIVIEEHGGEIGIESEENIGTKIWFSLPNCTLIEQRNAPIITSRNTEKFDFEDLEKLKIFLPELKALDIFQISELLKIQRKFTELNLADTAWVKAFSLTIKNVDENRFIELINILDQA